eukprot:5557827-Pleurochrysis_carterae.AAC.1
MSVGVRAVARTRTCERAEPLTHKRTSTHERMCVLPSLRACVVARACVLLRVRARVRLRACVRACACVSPRLVPPRLEQRVERRVFALVDAHRLLGEDGVPRSRIADEIANCRRVGSHVQHAERENVAEKRAVRILRRRSVESQCLGKTRDWKRLRYRSRLHLFAGRNGWREDLCRN